MTAAKDHDATRINARLGSPEPTRWLFTGDSITHGARHTGDRRDYVQLFEEELRWPMGRRRDVVIKTGISGWTIFDIADDLDWNVLQFRPHVLAVNVGVNDAARLTEGATTVGAWLDVYRRVLDRVDEACGASLILQTPTPLDLNTADEAAVRRTRIGELIDPIRRLTEERGAVLVDHWAHWAPHVASGRFREWLNDPLHPNAVGHREMARTLLAAMGKTLSEPMP